MEPKQHYLTLDARLLRHRAAAAERERKDEAKENEILDEMDVVWRRCTDEDRKKISQVIADLNSGKMSEDDFCASVGVA